MRCCYQMLENALYQSSSTWVMKVYWIDAAGGKLKTLMNLFTAYIGSCAPNSICRQEYFWNSSGPCSLQIFHGIPFKNLLTKVLSMENATSQQIAFKPFISICCNIHWNLKYLSLIFDCRLREVTSRNFAISSKNFYFGILVSKWLLRTIFSNNGNLFG